jgi:hypothetical protein
MSRRFSRRAMLGAIVSGCALMGSVGAPTAAPAAPSNAAVTQAARVNGRSETQIRTLLADTTAKLDARGRIYYVDPAPVSPSALLPAQPAAPAPYPYAQTFTLHSQPGSRRVIYLDFDGETIAGTAWNDPDEWGTPPSYFAEPFSLDASPADFSTAEQDVVQSVWQRVAEDYAPFDVDVTTQDPGPYLIDREEPSDPYYGTRALITDAPEVGATCGCGGVAYLGVFDIASDHAYYQPALVFPESLADDPKNIAEATSHEVGHNFGLSHDGAAGGVGYYEGHGSWAPIMGVGYYRPIVQWSRGEYAGANNGEDDLATIDAHGAPLRADDVGDVTGSAWGLGPGPSASLEKTIGTDADVDMFKVTAAAGAASFSVTPAASSPNLDAQLTLRNSAGTVIATSNPTSASSSTDVATGMAASISMSLPSIGTYYAVVEGVGALNPLTTGYSGYGSIGRYTLSATFRPYVANDDFAAATPLPSSEVGSANGRNVGATKQPGEPNHASVAGGTSVWFKWTAPYSETVTFDTSGSTFDTLLAAYTGKAVNALSAKASNDNDGASAQSRLSFAAVGGTAYWIAVDGKAGAAGAIQLAWLQRPRNDAFASPTVISDAIGLVKTWTVGATRQAGEPKHAGVAGFGSVWYRWTAPAAGKVTFDSDGSAYDTLLAVYTGTSLYGLTPRASNDGGGAGSKVTFTATAGTVYRIAVDSKYGGGALMTLRWAQAPPNDPFVGATAISGLSGSTTELTLYATAEPGEPVHGSGAAKSVWFKWTAPKTGTLTLDTIGSSFDTLLGIYTGTAIGALTTKATNDDIDAATVQSRIVLAVTKGTVYRFVVDGRGGASGTMKLRWSLP